MEFCWMSDLLSELFFHLRTFLSVRELRAKLFVQSFEWIPPLRTRMHFFHACVLDFLDAE